MITITKKEYLQLLLAGCKLKFLEIGGVDNWEWYGESLNDEYDKEREAILNKIK